MSPSNRRPQEQRHAAAHYVARTNMAEAAIEVVIEPGVEVAEAVAVRACAVEGA